MHYFPAVGKLLSCQKGPLHPSQLSFATRFLGSTVSSVSSLATMYSGTGGWKLDTDAGQCCAGRATDRKS